MINELTERPSIKYMNPIGQLFSFIIRKCSNKNHESIVTNSSNAHVKTKIKYKSDAIFRDDVIIDNAEKINAKRILFLSDTNEISEKSNAVKLERKFIRSGFECEITQCDISELPSNEDENKIESSTNAKRKYIQLDNNENFDKLFH